MRLRLAYTSHNVPVEVSVEGDGLTPDKIPSVLGLILEQLESWLEKITLEKESCHRDDHPGKGVGVDLEQAQPEAGPKCAISSSEPTPPETKAETSRPRMEDPQARRRRGF